MRPAHMILSTGLSLIFIVLTIGILIPPSTLNPLDKAGNTIQVISSNTPSPTQSPPTGIQASQWSITNSQTASASPRRTVSFFPTRPASGAVATATTSGNLLYHNGPTMHTSITYSIFWLPSSSSFEPSLGGNDSSYESLNTRFLKDIGGTTFYNILNQYPDSTNGTPLANSTFGGSYVDTTPYPAKGTQSNPLHDQDIQFEVARAMTSESWTPAPNKIFFVFTGYGIESCMDPFNTTCTFSSYPNGYCAYHSYFTQGGQPTIYANMPDFMGTFGRCNYVLGTLSPNADHYADPEISVASHELFEAVSDPQFNAWQDLYRSEIGDKCYTDLGNYNSITQSNLVINGHEYLVQQEWSNYSNGCVLIYGPSNSISVSFISSWGTTPISLSNSFNMTYTANGSRWWTTTAYTNENVTIFVDQNTNVTISGASSASNQLERWCFTRSCSDVSFNSGNGTNKTYSYYNLLAQQVSISIMNERPRLFQRTTPVLPKTRVPQMLRS